MEYCKKRKDEKPRFSDIITPILLYSITPKI